MSVKYVLQKNSLFEDSNLYAASVRTAGSVGLEEIADRIVDQGTTVRRADVLAVLENAINVCDTVLLDGMRVQFGGLVDLFPKIKGNFNGPTDVYDPARHRVDVAAMPGNRVRRYFRENATVERGEARKPVPGLMAYSQIPAGETPDIITPGAIGTIHGKRLAFNPTIPEEGIFLVPWAAGPEIRISNIQKNMPSQLTFLVPSLVSTNKYFMEIRTRYTEEGQLRIGRLDGWLVASEPVA
jgi:hypothetical protein